MALKRHSLSKAVINNELVTFNDTSLGKKWYSERNLNLVQNKVAKEQKLNQQHNFIKETFTKWKTI